MCLFFPAVDPSGYPYVRTPRPSSEAGTSRAHFSCNIGSNIGISLYSTSQLLLRSFRIQSFSISALKHGNCASMNTHARVVKSHSIQSQCYVRDICSKVWSQYGNERSSLISGVYALSFNILCCISCGYSCIPPLIRSLEGSIPSSLFVPRSQCICT